MNQPNSSIYVNSFQLVLSKKNHEVLKAKKLFFFFSESISNRLIHSVSVDLFVNII